jgi:hypothetical protein
MIGARDFSKATQKSLKAKGIEFMGLQAYRVEYENGSWGYERAYKLNDNGTAKVRTFLEVLEMAK